MASQLLTAANNSLATRKGRSFAQALPRGLDLGTRLGIGGGSGLPERHPGIHVYESWENIRGSVCCLHTHSPLCCPKDPKDILESFLDVPTHSVHGTS